MNDERVIEMQSRTIFTRSCSSSGSSSTVSTIDCFFRRRLDFTES